MVKKVQKKFRRELTPKFLAAAKPLKNGRTKGMLKSLLFATEYVRQHILAPASQDLDHIVVEHKNANDQRNADAKTLTIKTDRECEAEMERHLGKLFPGALLISEEKYGASSSEEKRRVLEEAIATDRIVILTDPLDATRDFRQGGDGYAVMVALLQNGDIKAAAAHRCTDHADPEGLGHTLTFESGDSVRIDGKLLTPLSERVFSNNPQQLRGYAGSEFIEPMHRQPGMPTTAFPNLAGKFDSLSDLWTCSKLYDDLITGQHHFMLVPPPVDIFDYPAGIALLKEAGGVVKFLDGTPATFKEIALRQACFSDENTAKSIHNTLIFAVSENVFDTVQKTVYAAAGITPPTKPKPPSAPQI